MLSVVFALVAGVLPIDAAAQPAAPTQTIRDQAAKHMEAALAAELAQDYSRALELNEQAYALIEHPILLFNKATYLRHLNRRDEAIDYYQRFLDAIDDREPQAKQLALDGLEQLRRERAAASARPGAQARPAAAAPDTAQTRQTEETRATEARADETDANATKPGEVAATATVLDPTKADADETSSVLDSAATASESRRDRRWTRRLTALSFGGAGIVSIGVGLYFGHRARSLWAESQAPGHCYGDNWCGPRDRALIDDARGNATISTAFVTVGALAVVGGAVLYLTGPRETPPRPIHSIQAQPMLSPTFVGLALTGSL